VQQTKTNAHAQTHTHTRTRTRTHTTDREIVSISIFNSGAADEGKHYPNNQFGSKISSRWASVVFATSADAQDVVNLYGTHSLQHTTHCNTPQHTATHCNTLQHTATRCNKISSRWASVVFSTSADAQDVVNLYGTHSLQHTAQHTVTHCSTHCNTHCNTLQQHCNTHCNTLQQHLFALGVCCFRNVSRCTGCRCRM